MRKFFGTVRGKVLGFFGAVTLGATSASAAPVAVDFTDVTSSVTTVGEAIIGVAVLILMFGIVYGFVRNRG